MQPLVMVIALCVCAVVAFFLAMTTHILSPDGPWKYTADELPDDEVTVLAACADGDVHEAYCIGEDWFFTHHPDDPPTPMPGVYAWMDVPHAPPPR